MKIDVTKPVKTRSGMQVKLIPDVKGRPPFVLLGAFEDREGWFTKCWTEDGKDSIHSYSPSPFDLVQDAPRVKRTVYLNVYPTYAIVRNTKENAIQNALCDCLATVEVNIDVEEGHTP